MAAWDVAKIYREIQDVSKCVGRKEYALAFSKIRRLATENRDDPWAQAILDEGKRILVDAEPHIALAEVMAKDQKRLDSAVEELEKALDIYGTRPGLWPLLTSLLAHCELTLRLDGREGDPVLDDVKGKRAHALEQAASVDERPPWTSTRIGGLHVVTTEDPWPSVVKAFCDSRPAARVSLLDSPRPIPEPCRTELDAAVADIIRRERPGKESWDVVLHAPEDEGPYTVRLTCDDQTHALETSRDRVPEALPRFLEKNWPL